MKSPSLFLLAFFMLSALIISGIADEEDPIWKVKIEYENGIKVIRNPETPLYGEIQCELALEEDLRLGKGEEFFFRVADVKIDDEENIYILDSGHCNVRVYDKKGNLFLKIGGRGQGPGEFEEPAEICLDNKKNIYVKDRRKIHIFNIKGEFQRSILLEFFLGAFKITEEGNILSQMFQFSSGETKAELVLFGPEGQLIKEIAGFTLQLHTIKMGEIAVRHGSLYLPRLYFCLFDKKKGIYGFSSSYSLFVFGSSGEMEYIIKKEEVPKPITKKEKDKMIDLFMESRPELNLPKGKVRKAFHFPPHRPFYDGIMTDGKGNLYVRRFDALLDKNRGKTFDMFNREGYYLHRLTFPTVVHKIKQGKIYVFENDQETGEFIVKRYNKLKSRDIGKNRARRLLD